MKLPPYVQRHRDNHVSLGDKITYAIVTEQPPRKLLPHIPLSLIFELVDQVFQRILEDAQPQDAIVIWHAVVLAKRTWRAPVAQRRAATVARRG